MELTLKRTEFRPDGIFSELSDESGKVIAHTLEHSYSNKPKVQDGEYYCVRGLHNLHSGPIETFEIIGVKGHSGILFHIGNWNKDSDGCVLLGSSVAQSKGGQMVTDSKAEFAQFMDMLKGVDKFQLTVRS